MNDFKKQNVLGDLVLRKLDGTITAEQEKELFTFLKSHPEAVDYYVEFILLYTSLSEPREAVLADAEYLTVPSADKYHLLMDLLAENERIAAPVKIEPEKAQDQIVRIDRSKIVKRSRRVNKLSLVIAITSVAALLLMILYVRLYPRPVREPVATLTDTVNVVWANSALPTRQGDRLNNYDGLRNLLKGYAKILFDNGAEVIIEAPAEFELKSYDLMAMNYGRVFVRAPTGAEGFKVNTPNSSIVDLGTEFGVKVDIDGSSELSMFKGRASLVGGKKGQTFQSMTLTKGQAMRVDNLSGEVCEIETLPHTFVRHISSKTGLVWRGEDIDLVDLASGGNGFKKKTNEYTIDPGTVSLTNSSHIDRNCSNDYRKIAWNSVVDGVFVPNGLTPQIVTSLGHQFAECPPTNGVYCSEIVFNPQVIGGKNIIVNGTRYGTGYRPGLFMHANLGITFDLNAIRARNSSVDLKQFKSKVGNTDGAPFNGNADVWILVDGRIRYKYFGLTKGQEETIEVPLSKADRFLTLVTTDGGDEDFKDGLRSSNSDWCVFMEPVLELAMDNDN